LIKLALHHQSLRSECPAPPIALGGIFVFGLEGVVPGELEHAGGEAVGEMQEPLVSAKPLGYS
jgi:hypothetical protein